MIILSSDNISFVVILYAYMRLTGFEVIDNLIFNKISKWWTSIPYSKTERMQMLDVENL